jgi:hypothetical protein
MNDILILFYTRIILIIIFLHSHLSNSYHLGCETTGTLYFYICYLNCIIQQVVTNNSEQLAPFTFKVGLLPWSQHVILKRWYPPTTLRSVITLKNSIIIKPCSICLKCNSVILHLNASVWQEITLVTPTSMTICFKSITYNQNTKQ